MAERIEEKDSQKLYVDDMVRYSIIVNRKRQIPDIKDGLKPVQRRIIYDMYKLGAFDNHNMKSGLIVGDTMGKYHCHGDSSIYGAMEPLANWYKSKVPIIKGLDRKSTR
jgi:DNA gyrase/topoisomerase IV subunit A